MRISAFDVGLERGAANYVPLSPLSFLQRAARVFPARTSIIHGSVRFSWAETYERCCRLASALVQRGVGVGDTVAVMLPNTPAMFEAHFGVPMAGAVLNTLNTRLDAEAIAFMLEHGEARVLLTDREFSSTIEKALSLLSFRKPIVIDVEDELYYGGRRIGETTYETFLLEGDPEFAWKTPADEWNAIALNYTSGTTGDPKGVVAHHRGAYLNAIANVLTWHMPLHPTYLWTLPMFHCNGWCFPWTLALQAGTSVCLRKVDPDAVFSLIGKHQITHMCGAPIVYAMLMSAQASSRSGESQVVQGLVAGAAPPAAIIEGCERMGIELTHVYGLTEVYGPAAVCVKQTEWGWERIEERARLNARQGVAYPLQESIEVVDPETMRPVPRDGVTMGEVLFRGNLVMKGYLKNPAATSSAFADGWFHTGDLAVVHADGYVKIKDRSKDIIISGGENISSLEVEEALYCHPAVMVAAVVAAPDTKWGEVPCAFLELRDGATVTEAEIVEHCRSLIARYKVPRRVVFGPIPKTSTGKIQKFMLREQVNSTGAFE